jgi:hypothetical protein
MPDHYGGNNDLRQQKFKTRESAVSCNTGCVRRRAILVRICIAEAVTQENLTTAVANAKTPTELRSARGLL